MNTGGIFTPPEVIWSYDNELQVLMGRWPIKDYKAYTAHILKSNPSSAWPADLWQLVLYTNGDGFAKGKFASLLLQQTPTKNQKFYYHLGFEDRNGKELWKKQTRVRSSDGKQSIGDMTFLELENVDNIVKADGSVTLLAALSFGSHSFQHRDNLSKDLGMLLDGKHSDVEIRCDGGVIKAHRAILAVRSSMFSGMFDSDSIESQSGVITIDAYDFVVVRKLLEYIYTSHIELNDVYLATELRVAADYYQVHDLVQACEMFITENVDKTSVIVALLSTAQLESMPMRNACLATIKEAKNVDEIDDFEELFSDTELSKLVVNHLMQ